MENDNSENMKNTNLKNMKIRWLTVLIVYGIFVCLFFVGKHALESQGMEYREYVTCIGYLIVWTVPWVCGLLAVIKFHRQKMLREELTGWPAGGIAILVLYLLVMLLLSGIACGYGLLNLRMEEKKGDILIVHIPHFLQATETYYCDPVGPFARKEFIWDGEREKKLLEQEYDMSFTLVEDASGNRSYIPEEYPQIQITIENPVPLQDNFAPALAAWYFEKTYEEQKLKTAYTSEAVSGFKDQFYLTVNDRADLQSCAQDAAVLIEAACRDPFFDEHAGYLTCILKEGAFTHRATLYFGDYQPFEEEGKQPDHYADAGAVLSQLSKEWQEMEDSIPPWSDTQGDDDSQNDMSEDNDSKYDISGDNDPKGDISGYDDSQNGMTGYDQNMEGSSEEARIASAAGSLYEELKGSKDGFQESYNAKGNLYVTIEMDVPESEGGGTVQRSIVFDRMSKNERCYLFALYEGDSMIDYYAVNIATKEVTASGKHRYADTGSKAYQEAAGEP